MDTLVIKNNIIHIFPDSRSLFQTAAIDFTQRAIATVKEKSSFTVALSGGETSKFFFDELVKYAKLVPSIPWQQIYFFFGDERYVASSDPNSNYYTAMKHLFSKLPIPTKNIYRMPTELNDPNAVALQYAQTTRRVFNCKEDELPQFDLVYLGLGKDAHTASLMPRTDLVKNYLDAANGATEIVKALWVDDLKMYRITLTPPILNNSLAIHFLVSGTNKELATWEVLKGALNPLQYPAQLINCNHAKTLWYLDEAAAKKLKG